MTPEIGAAIIAGGVGVITLIGTIGAQIRGYHATITATHDDVAKTLKEQRKQLKKTLAQQRTRTLNERFATAADMLGNDKPPAVQLAGVYAMAGLADDWRNNRQTCVDVLCAYMRLPYESYPGSDAPAEERLAFGASRQVRHTVIKVLAAHLQIDAADSWQHLRLDLAGVVFDGGDFSGVTFSSGQADFTGATFSGGHVDFTGATFSGSQVSFKNATFAAGGQVRFSGAKFSGGQVDFSGAKFSAGQVDFRSALFTSGGQVDFSGAMVSGSQIYFNKARFSGGQMDFGLANFSDGRVDFGGAGFLSGRVSLRGAVFSPPSEVHFGGVEFSGSDVDFGGATFSGGEVDFRFPGSWSHKPKFDWEGTPPPGGVRLPAQIGP